MCGCLDKIMSVVPHGIFAAKKIRNNEEKIKKGYKPADCLATDLSLTKYSSKYMNSIWGMYNRYSVHNLKKNYDDCFQFTSVAQQKYAPALYNFLEMKLFIFQGICWAQLDRRISAVYFCKRYPHVIFKKWTALYCAL